MAGTGAQHTASLPWGARRPAWDLEVGHLMLPCFTDGSTKVLRGGDGWDGPCLPSRCGRWQGGKTTELGTQLVWLQVTKHLPDVLGTEDRVFSHPKSMSGWTPSTVTVGLVTGVFLPSPAHWLFVFCHLLVCGHKMAQTFLMSKFQGRVGLGGSGQKGFALEWRSLSLSLSVSISTRKLLQEPPPPLLLHRRFQTPEGLRPPLAVREAGTRPIGKGGWGNSDWLPPWTGNGAT